MDGAGSRLAELLRKYADRPMDLADFEIYRTRTGKRLEILP